MYRKPIVFNDNNGTQEELPENDYVSKQIIQQIHGQFLLDPGEINGWGAVGAFDNTNNQDLGNIGANNLSRITGGLSYPFDVRLKRFYCIHRNNNNEVQPWGWVIGHQLKNNNSNSVSTTFIYDESFDRGNSQFSLRDYGNTVTRISDIITFPDIIIPSGNIIFLAVGAPTAVTANRYVQIMSGYLIFERT